MAQEEFLDAPMLDIIQQWRYYFSVLSPDTGDEIIDVGCNTGDAERLLMRDYPEIARVVGVENDQARYERAAARCEREQASTRIEFELADAQSLPFADCSFDKALCVETLEWIEDPLRALGEIRRVLRPGGVGVIIHSDFDTQVFNATDKKLCRQVVQSFADSGPNGQMGRELYGLCGDAGFSSVEPLVYVLINTESRQDLYAYRVAHMMAEWLAKKSLVSEDELARWIADIEEQNRRGVFFHSINRYICRCMK